MSVEADPVLDAIVRGARGATSARQAWIVRRDGDRLVVVAAAGENAGALLGTELPGASGNAGYVVESGQPLALSGSTGEDRVITSDLAGAVTSLLCVPCGDLRAVHGAMELVDKPGDSRFSIDDVEVATLLGGIAGAALTAERRHRSVPSPAELGTELSRIAELDPGRYSDLAEVISALLARG